MEILEELATKVLPLYGFAILGWYVKQKWNLNSRWISKILLYLLIPFLIIENLLKADLMDTAIIGSIIFVLAIAMNVPALFVKKSIGKDYNGNLLKSSFSYYNIGWFGIPIVTALFGEEQMPLIISAYVGNALYGDTIGYYLMSRTKGSSVKSAIAKVFKIPAVYACGIAISLNAASIDAPEVFESIGNVISWVVSSLGMLIIGLTLATIDFKKLQYAVLSKILGIRYLAGAIILGVLVFAEVQFIGSLEDEQTMLILLMASFPVAANLVVFASYLETEEQDASALVGYSSLISLVLVPLLAVLLF